MVEDSAFSHEIGYVIFLGGFQIFDGIQIALLVLLQ